MYVHTYMYTRIPYLHLESTFSAGGRRRGDRPEAAPSDEPLTVGFRNFIVFSWAETLAH